MFLGKGLQINDEPRQYYSCETDGIIQQVFTIPAIWKHNHIGIDFEIPPSATKEQIVSVSISIINHTIAEVFVDDEQFGYYKYEINPKNYNRIINKDTLVLFYENDRVFWVWELVNDGSGYALTPWESIAPVG